MLMGLMEKLDNMQEWMGNVNREMEIIRIKEKSQNSKTQTGIKNAFHGLVSTLDTVDEVISELEDV